MVGFFSGQALASSDGLVSKLTGLSGRSGRSGPDSQRVALLEQGSPLSRLRLALVVGALGRRTRSRRRGTVGSMTFA